MFKIVAENLQPFDARAKAVFALDEQALVAFLSSVENTSAEYIDVNPGPLKKDKEKLISFLVKNIERYSRLNILIDSTDKDVIEIAINNATRKPVINGFSMEGRKLKEILPLARSYDCEIVGLLMGDGYLPKTLEEKIMLAENMITEAEKSGIERKKIILDPVVAPLGWSEGVEHNKANIEFIKLVPQLFGEEIRTICGLSNLTTRAAYGARKSFLESLYLSMLYGAGIDMVMIDVFDSEIAKATNFIKTVDENRVFSFSEFTS